MSKFSTAIGLTDEFTLTLDLPSSEFVKHLSHNTRPWGLFAGNWFNDFGHEFMGTVTKSRFELQLIRFSFNPFDFFKRFAIAVGTILEREDKLIVDVAIKPNPKLVLFVTVVLFVTGIQCRYSVLSLIAWAVFFVVPAVLGMFWSIQNLRTVVATGLISLGRNSETFDRR